MKLIIIVLTIFLLNFVLIGESKDISYINLTLDETEGNRSYNQYEIAKFGVYLDIPGKTVYLDSNYSGWIQQSNISAIYVEKNLSSTGFFSLTAWWDGDENYTPASKTYYFDNIAPQYSNELSEPLNGAFYSPNKTYYFKIYWNDASLTEVKFESNFSGKFRNYTTKTNPRVYNESGTFWINLTDLPARNFVYKWYAKDSLNKQSNNSQKVYLIFKAYALTLYAPYGSVINGTTTVVTCYSITDQLTIDDFNLYRNSTLIENTTLLSRTDISILPVGNYVYVCKTTGTQNYTNQSLTANLTVSSKEEEKPVIKKEFKITNVSSPQINIGENGQGTFNLSSTLNETLFDIKITLTGVDLNWYTVEGIPNAILMGGSSIIKINFDIPSDAEEKTYDIKLKVSAKEENTNMIRNANEIMYLTILPEIPNQPPSYFDSITNNTLAGRATLFSLKLIDDSGLSGYIFSTNNSGIWINDSWKPLIGKVDWSKVVKILNSKVEYNIGWKIYVNDTDNEWTVSEEYFLKTREWKNDFTIPLIIAAMGLTIAIIILIIGEIKAKKFRN